MVLYKKNDRIDYLKAFAAILVVLHHAIEYSGLEKRSGTWALIVMLADSIHVPLFFSIAGYLCHKQEKGQYLRKKTARILIPFFTFSLLKLAYSTLISSRFSHASSLAMQLYDAFILGHLYWFPYAMFLCYCLAMLFWTERDAVISKVQSLKICIAFAVLVIVNMLFGLEDAKGLSFFQIGNALSYFCFFLAGMIFRQHEAYIRQILQRYSFAATGVCAVVFAAVCWLLVEKHLPYGFRTRFFLSFSLILPICFLVSKLPDRLVPLKLIGRYSLQIMFFDSINKIVFFGCLRQFMAYRPALALICVILNITATCIACMIIEKIPFVRRLFGL